MPFCPRCDYAIPLDEETCPQCGVSATLPSGRTAPAASEPRVAWSSVGPPSVSPPAEPVPGGGYITVLGDAVLVRSPSSSNYVVYGRASGLTLCVVPAQTAMQALSHPQEVTRLGSSTATLRGRADTWSIWYGLDVVWAGTADVATAPHAARLVDEFAVAVAEAEREGRVHSPSPPPNIAFQTPPLPSSRRASGEFAAGFADGFKGVLSRGGGRRAFGRRR